MAFIEITATEDVLRALYGMPDVRIVKTSFQPGDYETWTCSAYCSDEAVDAVTALGAKVRILLSTEQDAQQWQRVATDIARVQAERGER